MNRRIKRTTFRYFDYIPRDRNKKLLSVLEKPYIHNDFKLMPHKYSRWYKMYKNGKGETQVYFSTRKFPHFNTIVAVLGDTPLDSFPDVVIKLLDIREKERAARHAQKAAQKPAVYSEYS
uniref:Uncharacterized protein n=1 Tax=viral metagenome TaxID=1070528 RepID=A0A6C0JUH7_9ZZZZ